VPVGRWDRRAAGRHWARGRRLRRAIRSRRVGYRADFAGLQPVITYNSGAGEAGSW